MKIDEYVTDVLMRDLVGHDRRPASFLVYLWLASEQHRRGSATQISYQDLAENIASLRVPRSQPWHGCCDEPAPHEKVHRDSDARYTCRLHGSARRA